MYIEDTAQHTQTVCTEQLVLRVQVLQQRTDDNDDFLSRSLLSNLLQEQVGHTAEFRLEMNEVPQVVRFDSGRAWSLRKTLRTLHWQ